MVFWLVGTIIIFGVVMFFYVKKLKTTYQTRASLFTSYFCTVCFISIYLLCVSFIVSKCCQREAIKQVETVKIRTLSNNPVIYISRYGNLGAMEYHYIADTENGLTFGEARAEDSYINFTNETPRVEIYETMPKNQIIDVLFGWPDYEYYFYIPEGSITDG